GVHRLSQSILTKPARIVIWFEQLLLQFDSPYDATSRNSQLELADESQSYLCSHPYIQWFEV
ncbi:MAG: hypothetical protein KME13_04565, partial [Myxacorys californica WJT36-NPBG1]|nr:hypothetical protein [Myxacorys californica WJT36-NPBG1]